MTSSVGVATAPARSGPRSGPKRTWWVVGLIAVAVAVRLPFLDAPLTADEGGYLMVASQWHAHGSSLYGNYWVDRPPLLIALFAVAQALGGTVGLRLIGCAAVASSIALAHVTGRRVGTSRTAELLAPAATAAFLSTPLFGSADVNGELLATPFVLGGMLTAWTAHTNRSDGAHRLRLWALTGLLGTAAVLVKQNFVDVFVFAVVLLLAARAMRVRTTRETLVSGAALVGGGLVSGCIMLALAAARGTSPLALWDAAVVFRADALRVIQAYPTASNHERFLQLLANSALTGADVLLALILVAAFRRPRSPLLVAVAALAAWEVTAALAGGSFWLPYLIGVVPALTWAAAELGGRPGSSGVLTRGTVVAAAVVSLVACGWAALERPTAPTTVRVGQWLAASARPGDTATVLYGQANLLQAAGLQSPYPELWSLPVRVRDPHLQQLSAVLDSPNRPTWLVVSGSVDAWQLDPRLAERAIEAHYRLATTQCGYEIYLRDGIDRPLARSVSCAG